MGSDLVLHKGDFEIIRDRLYDVSGITLADHKRQMVENRIVKRIQSLGLAGFPDYVSYLQDKRGREEIFNLVNALTTNVTHFFRENHHFEHLEQHAVEVMRQRQNVRIWSAACSIGAEPYSIALSVYEVFKKQGLGQREVKILATDIDTTALEQARLGEYYDRIIKGMPKSLLLEHFTKRDDSGEDVYRIKDYLRRFVYFNYLNFNDAAWPMSKGFDFIFCRNALIYFNRDKQAEYVGKMQALLRPGGFLYLGHSEHAVMDGQGYKICGQTIYQKPT